MPSAVAHGPNGPSAPAGSELIAAVSFAGRSAIGAAGSHGKCPSAHDVAALSPTLSCLGRVRRASDVEVVKPQERAHPAGACRVGRRREHRSEARVQIRVDDEREHVEAVHALVPHRPVRQPHGTASRSAGERVCHSRNVAREVRGCSTARAGAAVARERERHIVEDIRLERLGILGRQDGIEQQPLDMRRVRERVGERQLRAVRGAPERDLVHSERHADGLRVVGVVVGAVEVAVRADRGRAARGERVLPDECRRLLQRRADEEARLAGSAVVERDDPVAREEGVIEVSAVLVAEVEHGGRSLTRAAGDEHHDAALSTLGGERLDVKRDRARHATRAVERDDDIGARDAGCGVARGGRRGGLAHRSTAEERHPRRSEVQARSAKRCDRVAR